MKPYFDPPFNDAVWFAWIEDPGYSHRDKTLWRLEIDSQGNLVQNVIIYRRTPEKREEREESHALTLSKIDFLELRHRVSEVNFQRLEEIGRYFCEKDSPACVLKIKTESSMIQFSWCLTSMVERLLGWRFSEKATIFMNWGTGDHDIDSDLTEICKLVRLLDWILSKSPFQECHWESKDSKWLKKIESYIVKKTI